MGWLDDLESLLGIGGGPTPAYQPGGGGFMGNWPMDPNGYPAPAMGVPGSAGPANAVQPMGGMGAGGGGADGGGIMALLQMLTQLGTAGGGAYYGMNELEQMRNLYKQRQQDSQIAMNPIAMAQRTLAGANMLTPAINRTLAYRLTQAAETQPGGIVSTGMGQSPGAIASAQAQALAPAAEQNTLEGLNLGQQNAQFGFQLPFSIKPSDYLGVLGKLQNLGQGGAFPGVS